MKKRIAFLLVLCLMLTQIAAFAAEADVADIYVDNKDSGFTTSGTWETVSSGSSYQGDMAVTSQKGAWAQWEPEIKTPGNYQVYIRYESGWDKTSNAPVEIGHKEAIAIGNSINMNQFGGTEWHYLGIYYFEPGERAYVKLLSQYGGKVSADAVKFVFAKQQTPIPNKSNKQSLERMLSVNMVFMDNSTDAYLYGEKQTLSRPPLKEGEETYLPLDVLIKGIGAESQWSGEDQSAVVTRGETTVVLPAGAGQITVNGDAREIGGALREEEGAVLVPVQGFCEAFGHTVFEKDGLLFASLPGNPVDEQVDQYTIKDISDMYTVEVQVPEDTYLLEAESFTQAGGWVLDQQSMDLMGSPYLMAHGLGKPVADASTNFQVKSAGNYTLWVRTRNWAETFHTKGAPGQFKVKCNGQEQDTVFGLSGEKWHWQKGGTVSLQAGNNSVALHDLTGFNGRCDAVLLVKDGDFTPPDEGIALQKMREAINAVTIADKGNFDLVVVGGGVAGVCASVGAARLGVKVALIQDRPVLGGNASSEVKVGIQGETNFLPYPYIGKLVREYEKADKFKLVQAEENLTLFMNYHADQVDMGTDRSIKAVYATDIVTGERMKVTGTLFADCTGDGTLGYIAGADYDILSEGMMGASNLWGLKKNETPTPFPEIDWGYDLSQVQFPGRREPDDDKAKAQLGQWYWESGMKLDNAIDAEYVRDTNLMGMFSSWNALKNIDKRFENYEISYSTYITGKRESRRLMGDLILETYDVYNDTKFLDGLVPCTWTVDLHYADPYYDQDLLEDPYITYCIQVPFNAPFWLPYRTLYSRNIPNLFMAGRDISVTHEALGTTRVMRTTGMMGEIVALASKICKDHNALPRDVYQDHLQELLTAAKTAWTK